MTTNDDLGDDADGEDVVVRRMRRFARRKLTIPANLVSTRRRSRVMTRERMLPNQAKDVPVDDAVDGDAANRPNRKPRFGKTPTRTLTSKEPSSGSRMTTAAKTAGLVDHAVAMADNPEKMQFQKKSKRARANVRNGDSSSLPGPRQSDM